MTPADPAGVPAGASGRVLTCPGAASARRVTVKLAAWPRLALPGVDAAVAGRDLVVGQGGADPVRTERLALGVVDLQGHVTAVGVTPRQRDAQARPHGEEHHPVGRRRVRVAVVELAALADGLRVGRRRPRAGGGRHEARAVPLEIARRPRLPQIGWRGRRGVAARSAAGRRQRDADGGRDESQPGTGKERHEAPSLVESSPPSVRSPRLTRIGARLELHPPGTSIPG